MTSRGKRNIKFHGFLQTGLAMQSAGPGARWKCRALVQKAAQKCH